MALLPNTNTNISCTKGDKDVSWEQLLAPAPMGIAIMSQLMICASRITDISINKKPGSLMRHPESFRTTLVQIGNDAYTVFMKAHSNMEQIQIQMAQVPDYIQQSYDIIKSGTQNAKDKILPRRLKRIQEAADDGEKLSKEVANDFSQLIELISQVLEATTASIGSKEQNIGDKATAKLEEEKKRAISAKELELKNTNEARKGNKQMLTSLTTLAIMVCPQVAIPFNLISSLVTSSLGIDDIKQDAARTEREIKKIHEEFSKKLQQMHIDVKKEVDRDKTIQLLRDGLKNLGELKERWSGMARFFESVKNVIGHRVAKKLKDFTEDAEDVMSDESSIEKILAPSILEAKSNSNSASRLAGMYVNVSKRYILGNLASMQRMSTLEVGEVEEAQNKLQIACKEASDGILANFKQDNEQLIQSTTLFLDQITNQKI